MRSTHFGFEDRESYYSLYAPREWKGVCKVILPGSVCGPGGSEGHNLEEGPEGDDTGWVLGSPRSPHKRPLLDTPSGLEIGPHFASSR